MANVQMDAFGQNLSGVKPSYIYTHLFWRIKRAARTSAILTAMLKISGHFSHFEVVTKCLLPSFQISISATTERKGPVYNSCLLFTLQCTTKKHQLFAKKAGHRKQVHKQVLSMALHNMIRDSLNTHSNWPLSLFKLLQGKKENQKLSSVFLARLLSEWCLGERLQSLCLHLLCRYNSDPVATPLGRHLSGNWSNLCFSLTFPGSKDSCTSSSSWFKRG